MFCVWFCLFLKRILQTVELTVLQRALAAVKIKTAVKPLNLIKISIMLIKKNALVLFITLLFFSCSNITGRFAYKTLTMDTYHVMKNNMEFKSGSDIDWIYKIDKLTRPGKLGVITLKKRVVWVDIDNRTVPVFLESPNVHGILVDRGKGEYKIVIMKGSEQVDELYYSIY
jgi:hypothetical protein